MAVAPLAALDVLFLAFERAAPLRSEVGAFGRALGRPGLLQKFVGSLVLRADESFALSATDASGLIAA